MANSQIGSILLITVQTTHHNAVTACMEDLNVDGLHSLRSGYEKRQAKTSEQDEVFR